MLFNSFDFAIFLPIVFLAYWLIGGKRIRGQNLLIVLASYLFYGWWDWRFLTLIFLSTLVDYIVGRGLHYTNKTTNRKFLLCASILFNIGILGYFKYYNFFLENFIESFRFLGFDWHASSLRLVLPVGISFYTFQTLSYSIDVYRRKLQPTNDFIAFSAYVSFFPQLVAGPIERASQLLPQFKRNRKFDEQQAIIGLKQIVWGLFKKIVIADNCAQYVNDIFLNHSEYSGSTLILGLVYFAFQIYGDFSGYSDIAIGTARLFNFKLMTNFKYPYFSRDIGEFWRRWHISLSTWFRDYLYIPLGGSKGNRIIVIRNVAIIFLVSGFWHGANWTFIVWGGINALFFIPLMITKKNRRYLEIVAMNKLIPSLRELVSIIITFNIILLGWLFFRAESVEFAWLYLQEMATSGFKFEMLSIERYSLELVPYLFILVVMEWFSRTEEFPLFQKKYELIKTAFVTLLIITLGSFSNIQEFIYFQF
jgi:alginate O-acetyltransferase complex protein AlgI